MIFFMTLSITQDFLRFLRPGVAEDLIAASKSNTNWMQIARKLYRSRNALYTAIALAAIGAVGLALSGFGTPAMIAFSATLALGAIVALVALKIMHSQIEKYRQN